VTKEEPALAGDGLDNPFDRPFSRRRLLELAAALGGAGVVLAACGSSTPAVPGLTRPGAKPKFPIGAAAKSPTKPVPVTLWHSMTDVNLATLQSLTKQFNASQRDVAVTLVNQTSYTDTLSLYTAALAGGTLPQLVQIETVDLQLMIDSRSITPVGDAVAADQYDLSDFLPTTVDYFRTVDNLWAMPFDISTQILYYNKLAFSKAGLDPESPPASFEDLRRASDKIVSDGVERYGISLKPASSNFADWLAMEGKLFVNHDNGRVGRATEVAFGGQAGLPIFEWFDEMLSDKLAQLTSNTGFDNLLAVGNRISPMTIDTSAALGTVVSVLSGGHYSDVELGIGRLPGPHGPGGVVIGGAGLYIVGKSTPAQQDGAWQFTKFLVSPASQALWAARTGYIPIRKSSLGLSVLDRAWAAVPGYRVAYDQILHSAPSVATAGAVTGPLSQIDANIVNAFTSLASGTSPAAALASAVSLSNSDIASYDQRLGGQGIGET
jgi:sn-glycerol 3-phosphate transport system substrate-binding protein